MTQDDLAAPAALGSEASPMRSVVPKMEAYLAGKRLRSACPRTSHQSWSPAPGRPDPVDLMLQAEQGRIPELLPLRHGRMALSPFTFYRGSALAMAYDLASTPTTGMHLQCCGDAHLCNFGGFATPERRIIFSTNDLDETLPAPWEWDIKRLAASFVVACRDNGLSDAVGKDVVMACVRTYRESMVEYSQLRTLDLWYTALTAEELIASIPDPALRKRGLQRLKKEKGRSIAEDIFPKLVDKNGARPLIKDQLPTIFHAPGAPVGQLEGGLRQALEAYRATLAPAYQGLLDRYEFHDAAIKVVGIGSVGTACWVLLFSAGEGDPLFLQVKEARPSVLEAFAGASVFPNHGQRVVNGYRCMQPASDMFLGWTEGYLGRHYFIRQLRDVKISLRVETFGPAEMGIYATWCGKALALSHARSGDAAMLSGYMGQSDTFDRALASFSRAYADQNERDHAALRKAIASGRIQAQFEGDR